MSNQHPAQQLPYILLAVLGGGAAALQSRLNGTLTANYIGSPYATALLSFGVALLVITAALVWSPSARLALAAIWADARHGSLRWYQCLGGLAGAFFQFTQGLTVASLGVTIFMVAIVAGQSVAALLVDRLGMGPSAPHPITWARAAGPACALVAAAVTASRYFDNPRVLWLAAFPLLAGAGQSWQQAVNGRVRAAANSAAPTAEGSPAPATGNSAGSPPGRLSGRPTTASGIIATVFQNFVVGTAALGLVFALTLAIDGPPQLTMPTQPAMLGAGALAIVFIGIAAGVVGRIGVTLLGLGMIAGQVFGGFAIDMLSGYNPAWTTYTGLSLTMLAVLIPVMASQPGRAGQQDHVENQDQASHTLLADQQTPHRVLAGRPAQSAGHQATSPSPGQPS